MKAKKSMIYYYRTCRFVFEVGNITVDSTRKAEFLAADGAGKAIHSDRDIKSSQCTVI